MDRLALLAGIPIRVDNLSIYSPKLKEIADIGKEAYQKVLQLSTITKNIMINKTDNIHDDYDALLTIIYSDEEAIKWLLFSLKFFTKVEFKLEMYNDDLIFRNENMIINRTNYKEFINAVKISNGIKIDEDDANLDEFDRKCLEMEKKIAEEQNKNSESIELEDLISILANISDNGLNIFNIWDLTIFQFKEQLTRGQLKETYNLQLKQLLAGASPDDIQIESYYKSIK